MSRLLLFIALLAFSPCVAPPDSKQPILDKAITSAPQPKRKVLIIYSYHDTLPWQTKLRDALFARIQSAPTEQRPELFEERFEAHRLSIITSNENFLKLLEAKYRNVKFDLLVTDNDYAFSFIRQYPHFLSSVKRVSVTLTQGSDDEAVVLRENGVAAVETIAQVLPDVQRIIVVGGGDAYYRLILEQVKQAREKLAPRHINLELWDDFSFEELYDRARRLPKKNTAMLYLSISSDRLGNTQIPKDVLERLNTVAGVPIFAHHDSFLGAGAVGGYLLSANKIGDLLGRIILGQDIPKNQAERDVASKGYYFDDRELKRWHIDDRNLPAGSVIINRKHSVVYTYRWQIFGTLLALFAESLLIVALFRSLYERKLATKALAEQRDLLEQHVAERTYELTESRNLFQEAAKVAKFGVFDYNLSTGEMKWDVSMFLIYGVNPETFAVSYANWRSLLLPEDCANVENQLKQTITKHREFNMDFRIRRPEGQVTTIAALGHVSLDDSGQPQRIICFNQDITERKAAEKRINDLAFYDPLTGLPNRRLLYKLMQYQIDLGRRGNHCTAVLMLDLDRFKAVNDGLGHSAGDELLKRVAARIGSHLRHTDTVARLGGDEFTILLSNITHPDDAGKVAEKIIDDLSQPFQLSQNDDVRVGASIGICLHPQHDDSPEKLMDHADMALYQAKKEGRGRFVYFSEELTLQVLDRVALESQLRKAIERKEFRVYYQPQVDIVSGRIIGAEALVRWQTPDQGLIPPIRFIPVAEETGFIIAIGEWVLHETCRQGKAWLDAGLPPIRLAVNVSPHQFRYSNIAELVNKVLEHSSFPANCLELEMTESSLMENQDAVIEILNKIRSQGIHLAIDDFGTGYSSLAYLKKFPVDVLKIDKSFIDNIPYDQNDVEITSSIISMGHILGFKVLAEGVETPEQLAFLKEKGCNIYQGYIKSKPLPAEEFAQLLQLQTQALCAATDSLTA